MLAACGGDDTSAAGTGGGAAATGAATTGEAGGEAVTLRLGYFANVTHATPLVGVAEGLYEEALGANVTLETAIFNAGPAEIEALFAEAIDAGYIGPNPAVNGFVQSNGEALRIVSGATSGGAFLVVKPGITSAADLAGKVLATPSLGNTQDVALRGVPEGERPERRHERWAATSRSDHRRTPRRWTRSRRATSTAHGCRSRGRRGSSSKVAVKFSSTKPTSGRTDVSPPPC